MESDKPRFQKVFFSLGGAVIGTFAVAVLLGIHFFRTEIRHQILQRDGILLTSVANYLDSSREGSLQDELDLLDLALDSSRISGIIAVRVFYPLDTMFQSVPVNLYPVTLSPADRKQLSESRPVIRYFPDYPLPALFSDTEELALDLSAPLVEVVSPLAIAGQNGTAAIQYWMDGSAVAAEFSRVDRYLVLMGTLFIGGGVLIFSILFLYARARLLGMARVISDRNRALERVNAELAMVARTSAIGSVSSHLFHGLKNPLSGLKNYLRATTHDEEAVALMDRMQSLVDETLSVIRQEEMGMQVQLTMAELRETARSRLLPLAGSSGKTVRVVGTGKGEIEAHRAQLLLLVLRNLVENALEVTPPGGAVEVRIDVEHNRLTVEVADEGPGLPEKVRSRLFEPVRSSKADGSGIGLAICSALTRHIPASLELKSSDNCGTTFRMELSI